MPLKFCANLSFMFQETSNLLERYSLAKQAGFTGVECGFPYDYSVEELVKAKEESGVSQILLNAPPGNWENGERGFAAVPGKTLEFRNSIDTAVRYAKALNCKRIHIMSGAIEHETTDNMALYVERLRLAAETLEDNGIIGLIEPINQYSLPNYYLNSYEKAVTALQSIDSDNLKLQMDIFHLQHIKGNITRVVKELFPYIGHVQVAQVPDRHEPDSPGEIDFKYVFQLLESLGYDGWVGLEYNPAADTTQGLKWIAQMNYSL